MIGRITVLGGGHGLAAVLGALREQPCQLTAVVTIADDGGSSGELRRRCGGPAVGDLRRALIALAHDDAPLARALERPVTVEHLGRHPLGNVVIRALIDVFGDLERGIAWLAAELGLHAQVLPATVAPLSLRGQAGRQVLEGECAIGTSPTLIRRLRFVPERPAVSEAALAAVAASDLVLLGPGSLFTSVLAVCALPDMLAALAATAARVAWICNLQAEPGATANMSARRHLSVLRRHGVRVDAVLYDPESELAFAPGELARQGVDGLPFPLQTARRGVHDPELLRAALTELRAERPATSTAVG
jgi:uncharacterized cofD-like protein